MRVKPQTAPVWDFVDTAVSTLRALEAGELDIAKCGPWIDEVETATGETPQYLVSWNHWDDVQCDADELPAILCYLIELIGTDDDFRRRQSFMFYDRVNDLLEDELQCGDSVDGAVVRAWEAAQKVTEQYGHTNLYERNLEEMEKTPLRLETLAKMKRSCDRLIRLANEAYNVVSYRHGFGWEWTPEEYVDRGTRPDTPCGCGCTSASVTVLADYAQQKAGLQIECAEVAR